jgi:hypothetical protein
LTTSLPSVLLGAQRPRVSHHPAFSTSAGVEAVELAASAGLILDDWQRHVLQVALGERPDGKWSAFEVAVVVSRQNGKGSIIEARELAGLFLFDEKLILHSAHEFKTAQEAFRRVLSLVQNTPDLDRLVSRVRTSHGEEGIELRTGARLRFVARSTGSGRGFSGDVVILDEAYHLGSQAMGAMLPTLATRPNPQVWYTSSAGTEDSEVLATVRERGLAGKPGRLAYLEWSAPDDADLDDRQAWAQANPSLGVPGHGIGEEFIEAERGALPEVEFRRERLSIWSDSRREAAIDRTLWGRLVDTACATRSPVAFSPTINPERTKGAITAAILREDGKVQIEVIDYQAGTSWMLDRLEALNADWKPVGVALNPAAPEGSLITALQQRGIEPVLLSGRAEAQACGAFYDALTSDKIRHGNQAAMNIAVENAVKRDLGDSWVWHRRSATDIGPVNGATYAHHLVTSSQPEPEVEAFAMWLDA